MGLIINPKMMVAVGDLIKRRATRPRARKTAEGHMSSRAILSAYRTGTGATRSNAAPMFWGHAHSRSNAAPIFWGRARSQINAANAVLVAVGTTLGSKVTLTPTPELEDAIL